MPCFTRGRRSDIVRPGVPADVASLRGAHDIAISRFRFPAMTEVVDTTTATVEASTRRGRHWRLGRTTPIPVVVANDRPQARN